MEKMRMESQNGTMMNVNKIAALFPNCVTEAKGVDNKLKRLSTLNCSVKCYQAK